LLEKNVVQLFNCQHQVFFKLLLAVIMVEKWLKRETFCAGQGSSALLS